MKTQFSDNEDEIMQALCKDISIATKLVYGKTAHFALSVIEETEEDSETYIITNFASFSLEDNEDCVAAVADSILRSKDEVPLNE